MQSQIPRAPRAYATGIAPSVKNLQVASRRARSAPAKRCAQRPSTSAPIAPGRLEAVTARPTRAALPVSSWASSTTATTDIPSPRYEIARPGSTLRTCGCVSTGQ
ncbi:hypothetical protein JCM9957A_21020 [Kineosporia succinea]